MAHHNGVSERRNYIVLDMIWSMISITDLSLIFWGYALEIAIYLLNKVPTKSAQNTPYELWTDRKPNVRHLRIWGCPAHVKKQSADKLESRTDKCLFVGYLKDHLDISFIILQNKRCL